MTLRIVIVAWALSVGLFAKVSHAGLIAIEPDDYCEGCIIAPADGTSLSYAYKPWNGAEGDAIAYSPVYSAWDREGYSRPITPTGSLVIGVRLPSQNTFSTRFTGGLSSSFDFQSSLSLDSLESALGDAGLAALRIDFVDAVDFFSIDMFSESGDNVAALAFDAAGNLVEVYRTGFLPREQSPSCASHAHGCFQYVLSGERTSADIATLLVGSTSAAAGIDAIRYTVPAPSTFGLMLGAMLLMGFGSLRATVARG